MCWVPGGIVMICLLTLAEAISLQQCNGRGQITITRGQPYSVTCPHTDVTRSVTWAFTSLVDNVTTHVITGDCPLMSPRESHPEPFCQSQVPAFQIVRPHVGFTSLRIEWDRLTENMTYGLVTCVLDGKTDESCRIKLLMEAASSTPPDQTTTAASTGQSQTSQQPTAEASTTDLDSTGSTSSSVTSDLQSGSTTSRVTSDLQTTSHVTSDLQTTSHVTPDLQTTSRVTSDLESDSPLTSTPTATVSLSSKSSWPEVDSTNAVSTSTAPRTTTTDSLASSPSTTTTTTSTTATTTTPTTTTPTTTTPTTTTATTSTAPHLSQTQRIILIASVIAAATIIPALIVGVIVCCRWRKRRSLLQSTMSDDEGSLEFHNRLHEDTRRVTHVFHPTSAKGDNSAPSSPTPPASYTYASVKKPARVDPTMPYLDSSY